MLMGEKASLRRSGGSLSLRSGRHMSLIPKSRASQPSASQEALLLADARWQIASRIASSSALSRANQLREMLLFLVRQTILEPTEPIRESEIAHRVLGRRSDFNPLDDNIVRVQMAHLRKKLELYYGSDGKDESTILTIALGSYKPIFTPRAKAASEQAHSAVELPALEDRSPIPAVPAVHPVEPSVVTVEPARHGFRSATALMAATALLLAVSIGLGVKVYRQQQTIATMQTALTPWRSQPTVAALWTSFFGSSHDTDVILGDDSLLLVEQITHQYTSFNSYLNRSYLADSFVSTFSPADRNALNLIASKGLGSTSEFKLAQRIMAQDPLNRRLRLYGARQYVPTLLKQNNVILIGGRVSNPWEGLFDSKLSFNEGMTFTDVGVSSVMNSSPKPGEQHEYLANDVVGYCVIAFLPNQAEDRNVLLLEGTNSEATEAAGDFLLSEEQLSAFLGKIGAKSFPPFEVLLKITQVKGTPLTASIEAYRTYPTSR